MVDISWKVTAKLMVPDTPREVHIPKRVFHINTNRTVADGANSILTHSWPRSQRVSRCTWWLKRLQHKKRARQWRDNKQSRVRTSQQRCIVWHRSLHITQGWRFFFEAHNNIRAGVRKCRSIRSVSPACAGTSRAGFQHLVVQVFMHASPPAPRLAQSISIKSWNVVASLWQMFWFLSSKTSKGRFLNSHTWH